MAFSPTAWFQRFVPPFLKSPPRVHSARRKHPRQFWVEALEDRTTPTIASLTNFAGLAFPDSGGYVPPDTDMAVGPAHVVEVINSTIGIYSKTGTQLSKQSLDAFFGGGASGLFDPVASYDTLANRYIIAALEVTESPTTSFLWVAVSNTSDPTAGFTEKQKIDLEQNVSGTDHWGDYPKIGWNADAVVFTLNMFSFPFSSAAYDHTQIVTLQKTSILDANAGTLTKFSVDRAEFTMAAATMHGSVAGDPMYFVATGSSPNVTVIKMTNVLSASPTFAATNIAVNAFAQPPDAAQPGGVITANDARMLNAQWRNNRLVSAHAIGVGGLATVRWYEFNTTAAAPTLTQQGNVSPGAGIHTSFPAIAIAPDGSLGMSYMQSSATEFVSMYATGRINTDALGTMQTPILVKAGAKTYSDFSGSPYRAGDYSGIAVDPITGTFWAANEYATNAAQDNWGTWIVNFQAAPLFTTSLSLDASGNLLVQDIFGGGKNDNLTLRIDTANSNYVFTDPTTLSTFGVLGGIPGITISADKHTATVPFAVITGPSIVVTTVGGTDNLTLNYTSGAFPDAITYDGGTGVNSLTGPNRINNWNITAAGAGDITGVLSSFLNVQNLNGGTLDDIFVLDDNVGVAGAIDGRGGLNTLDYTAYLATHPVVIDLDNRLATNIGGGINNFRNLLGGAGVDTLVGFSNNNSWLLNAADAGTINTSTTFNSFANLTGGSGSDTFNFTPGFAITGQLDGGGGTNTIIGRNVDEIWNITGANQGNITPGVSAGDFLNIQNLTGGGGIDRFVFANGGSVAGAINGGGALNVLDYSAFTTGPVNVNLSTGAATLTGGVANIYQVIGNATHTLGNTFTGNNADNTWNLTADNTGTGSALFRFDNFANLGGGIGRDIFNFNAGFVIGGQLNGGAGSNTLVAPNASQTWSIDGPNRGFLPNTAAGFQNIQNLTGGSARDIFVFANGAVMGGTILGGGGDNWLNYAAFRTRLVINLATGKNSATLGGAFSFNNVIGSAVGGDALTGSTAGGVLVAQNAANTIVAGAGRSIVIGGYGKNLLKGGAADDLIINGRTAYDKNITALITLYNTWNNNTPYAQRVADLQTGPTPLKVGTTVTSFPPQSTTGPRFGRGSSLYESTILGNGGQDWYFTTTLSSIADKAGNETATLR